MDYQMRKRTTKSGALRYTPILEVWSSGQRSVVSGGTFTEERLAIRAGERLLSQYETDIQRAAALRGKMTFAEWIETWLSSRQGKIKESSRKEYGRKLRNWVVPYLGEVRLSELSAVHIRRWLDKLPAKGLGFNSQDQALGVLNICLNGAVRDGALVVNPATGVTVERSKALEAEDEEAKPVKVWDHDESRKLLAASEGVPLLDALITLGMLAGLRPGEVEGLKWEDIDFLDSTVTVRRADRQATSPKSGKRRTVKLPFEAVRRLAALQERQTGPWILNRTVKTAAEHLTPFCAAVGVPVLPPHSLRHTFASLLLSACVPVTAVAKILGHSDPAVTLRVYAHAMPKDVDAAAGVIERVLNVAPTQIPTHETVNMQVEA